MARKRAKAAAAGPPVTTVVVMRLYVAGKAPNSVKAIANLESDLPAIPEGRLQAGDRRRL